MSDNKDESMGMNHDEENSVSDDSVTPENKGQHDNDTIVPENSDSDHGRMFNWHDETKHPWGITGNGDDNPISRLEDEGGPVTPASADSPDEVTETHDDNLDDEQFVVSDVVSDEESAVFGDQFYVIPGLDDGANDKAGEVDVDSLEVFEDGEALPSLPLSEDQRETHVLDETLNLKDFPIDRLDEDYDRQNIFIDSSDGSDPVNPSVHEAETTAISATSDATDNGTETVVPVVPAPGLSRKQIREKELLEKENEGQSKRTRNLLIAGGIVVLIAGLGIGSYAIAKDGFGGEELPPTVAVGEAIGYAASDDTDEELCARFAGLDCTVEWSTHDGIDRGYLVSQSVPVGENIEENSDILLTYSNGPASSEFPEIEGRKVDSVESEMYEMGITVTEVTEVDSPVEKGLVVSSSVEPGTVVENGTEITLQVSNGSVEVPDWKGEPREVVEAQARNLGVEVAFREEESDETSGTVLAQSPEPGSVIASDGVVVTVAKNFDSVEIEVPELIGMTAEEAQTELASAGFRHINTVVVQNTAVTEEQVTQVVPGEGEKANSEEDIVIIVSTPDAPAANE